MQFLNIGLGFQFSQPITVREKPFKGEYPVSNISLRWYPVIYEDQNLLCNAHSEHTEKNYLNYNPCFGLNLISKTSVFKYGSPRLEAIHWILMEEKIGWFLIVCDHSKQDIKLD